MTVDVLLATYDGERHLREQLASLDAQTFQSFRVLARDDGSRDGTVRVLQDSPRVQLLHDARGRLGATGNFGALLEASSADRIFLCDQDDVWRPRKMELALAKMEALEQLHGAKTPLLVHTDLEVVDERLGAIAPSFWRMRGLDPRRARVPSVFVFNVVTGCATLINAALRRLATPIPEQAYSHDWWLALVAATLGKIEHLDEPCVMYRQHGRNVIGARRTALEALRDPDRMYRYYARVRAQAASLVDRYGTALPAAVQQSAAELVAWPSRPLWRRLARAPSFRERSALHALALALFG